MEDIKGLIRDLHEAKGMVKDVELRLASQVLNGSVEVMRAIDSGLVKPAFSTPYNFYTDLRYTLKRI